MREGFSRFVMSTFCLSGMYVIKASANAAEECDIDNILSEPINSVSIQATGLDPHNSDRRLSVVSVNESLWPTTKIKQTRQNVLISEF